MKTTKRRCVVLGGGGFLGTHLCRRLSATGFDVRSFGHHWTSSLRLPGVDVVNGNFADRDAVAAALEGFDIAFHLIHSTVPFSSNLDVTGDLRDNLIPTLAFLDLARQVGIKRVVFLSSGGTVYGRPSAVPTEETAPTDPIVAYGICKLAIEKYLFLYQHHFGLDYRILRVANPFGPFQVARKGQGLVAEVISRAIKNEPIEVWGDGSAVRDFIFVDDVIDAIVAAATDTGEERLFNVGSGNGRSVRNVLAAVEHALGRPLDIVWKGGRPVDVPVSILSIARARDVLGWEPKTAFEAGISKTIAWWQDNSDLAAAATLQAPVQEEADRAP